MYIYKCIYIYIYTYIYIYIYIYSFTLNRASYTLYRGKYQQLNFNFLHNKLATITEGNSKTPFSIAATLLGVGKGTTAFPGLLHFTIDPYLIMLSFK